MFQHLDDPTGFSPDDRFRSAVRRSGRTRLRRRRAATVAAPLAVGALAGTAALVGVRDRLEEVDHVAVGHPAPEPTAGRPTTVLVAGVDGPRDDGAVAGARTDHLVLLRVAPDRGVAVLPVPRDLWVEAPGGATRINQVRANAGPAVLLDVVRATFGIEVDRYVEIDFDGAVALGDAVGGLALDFPAPYRDPSVGFEAPAGCVRLDGAELLALARSRRGEVQGPGGTWRRDVGSDLGRIEREQAVLAAAAGALTRIDVEDPGGFVDLLDVLAGHVTLDDRTGPRDLAELVRTARDLPVAQLRLPLVDAVRGGADVLELGPATGEVVAAFAAGGAAPGTTPTAVADPLAGVDPVLVPTPC